ncbi:MAG: hypothetical protein M0R77_01070 [Gammaproteobacteria bacterium]|nr:hypothetical protein [Acholeplasmataceae bacterium]MCK9529147.1 hypothetical protein [Gammaproteobacteria bacterium]
MSQVTAYKEALKRVINNPSAIQRINLRLLREINGGELNVYDPSNPMVQLQEVSASGISSLLNGFESSYRKLYPVNARQADDLYLHMSDQDYIGRFALPSKAKFQLKIHYDDLINNLVAVPDRGYKKIVIPRNSRFGPGDLVFSTIYPIEIREMNHGGLTVVWDVNEGSPIGDVETNLIPFNIITLDNTDWFVMEFDTFQYEITSQKADFSPTSPLFTTVNFQDDFYFVRVYISRSETVGNTDLWEEIAVTHTDLVYNPDTITAAVKVLEQSVQVHIPIIYINRFNLVGKVRIDVYTTKGHVSLDLANLNSTAFNFSWSTIDNIGQSVYTKNLSHLEDVQVWSNDTINGGRNSLDLEELRRRVIYNTMGPRVPAITPDQIETILADQDFDIVKNVDNITNRIYLATKQLPDPTNNQLITAASLSIQSVLFNAIDAIDIGTVIDNGESITFTPETLFQNRNGRTYLVPKSNIDAIKALPIDQQASQVTGGNYFYTPFYYVMEMLESEFDARVYRLDAPEAQSKSFIAENDLTLLSSTISSYRFLKTSSGYQLEVTTTETDDLKLLNDNEVHAQISFRPIGEISYAYQNGELIGKTDEGSRVYRFDLSSNFNVTRRDGLELTEFFMFEQTPRLTETALLNDFVITFSTSATLGSQWRTNEADSYLGKFLLPNRIAAISVEKIRLKFGDALKELWIRARTIPGTERYETYPFDVPAYYLEDVYEKGPDGTNILFDNDGKPYFNILHHKGDPQLDGQGNPIYRHLAGSTVIDEVTGEPVVISPRRVYRQVDFMMVDGVYFFSTDKIIIDYRKELVDLIINWIINDIKSLTPTLLEKTKIFFYPKTTTGPVEIMYGAGLTTSLPAQQAFNVELHISDKVDDDEALKQQLTRVTIQALNDYLTNAVVSISDMIVELKALYGNDVMDVKITGLGGWSNDFPMVTIINLTDRLSLRKRLVARADGILIVEEDVSVNFIRHKLV